MEMDLYDQLHARGFIKQCTNPELVKQSLSKDKTTFYIGFDPTADCLHIGHLLPLMVMSWLQKNGHQPIIIMGGGTAMIGDPSGKDKTRDMLTQAQIEHNLQSQKRLFAKVVNVENAIICNNADWLTSLGYINFLRDIGKHFSVNKRRRH